MLVVNVLLAAPCVLAFAPPRVPTPLRWAPPTSRIFSPANSVTALPAADTDDPCDVLSWDEIRATLVRLEETIIFSLIERAQYRQNEPIYKVGGVPNLGAPPGSEGVEGELSFLEFMMTGTEVLHNAVGRYDSPEEYAFFPSYLPKRESSTSDDCLSEVAAANDLNWNNILYDKYLNAIVPAICGTGDDEQYGSSVISDISALQALSKKIHFGKFVAENKYQENPDQYQKLVDAGDVEGIRKLLINEEAEKKALLRARLKATNYGREPLLTELPKVNEGDEEASTAIISAAVASAVVAAMDVVKERGVRIKGKVDPLIIEDIGRTITLPMTIDLEVAYMYLRCGKEPPENSL